MMKIAAYILSLALLSPAWAAIDPHKQAAIDAYIAQQRSICGIAAPALLEQIYNSSQGLIRLEMAWGRDLLKGMTTQLNYFDVIQKNLNELEAAVKGAPEPYSESEFHSIIVSRLKPICCLVYRVPQQAAIRLKRLSSSKHSKKQNPDQ